MYMFRFQLSLHLSARRELKLIFLFFTKNLYKFPDREIYTSTTIIIIIIQFYTQCLAEVFMRLQLFFTFCQVTSRDVPIFCWAVMWQPNEWWMIVKWKPKDTWWHYVSLHPSSHRVSMSMPDAVAVANRVYSYLQADVQRPFFFLPPHVALSGSHPTRVDSHFLQLCHTLPMFLIGE